MPHYPIETARLHLRLFEPGDLDDLFEYMSRPDVVRYLYGGVKDLAEADVTLRRWMSASTLAHEDDRLVLAAVLRERRKVIGEVTLKLVSREHRQGEVGWIFNPDFGGQGYATEAATAMLTLGFSHYGFHRIFARCDARNVASYRLMERLGMRREAALVHNEFFKGEWGNEYVYALLDSEWAAR
jgi:RimJ/RimL family protein N-acetyltransferase